MKEIHDDCNSMEEEKEEKRELAMDIDCNQTTTVGNSNIIENMRDFQLLSLM